jgi:hypothetical protein
MLKSLIFLGVSAGLALAAGAARSAGDRYAGIYQFTPLPQGWCAARPPPAAAPSAATPRLQKLGELPPAYVIRLSGGTAASPPPGAQTEVLRTPAGREAHPPGYDPCAGVAPTLMRVR